MYLSVSTCCPEANLQDGLSSPLMSYRDGIQVWQRASLAISHTLIYCIFDIWFLHTALAVPELTIYTELALNSQNSQRSPSLPPECWNERRVPPPPTSYFYSSTAVCSHVSVNA